MTNLRRLSLKSCRSLVATSALLHVRLPFVFANPAAFLPYTGFVSSLISTESRVPLSTIATTPRPMSLQTADSSNNEQGPLESLCAATLQSCQALTPTIAALYHSINTSNTGAGVKKKADQSAFTIADGLVQHLLEQNLLNGIAGDFVGEENCPVNISQLPYSVDDLEIPSEFTQLIQQAQTKVAEAKQELLLKASNQPQQVQIFGGLTAFLDPIDGTREFSSQKGEQCSVCVGFSDSRTGRPVAGVVYRPLSDPPTWAAGAKEEGFTASSLDVADKGQDGLLTSNGSISPFLEEFMKERDWNRVRNGGAGNKMLLLLERKGSAYISDRGVSRWDTCAAQAVLEAHGGILCKLTSFMGDDDNKEESSYAYLECKENLDFTPGTANLTKYNAAEGVQVEPKRMATNASEVKIYANLEGLVALSKTENTPEQKSKIVDALKRAAKSSAPAYN